jgi:predicted MFS family arabinose efflux permease
MKQNDDKPIRYGFFLSSLFVSNFALYPPGILTGIFLIDIGSSFGVSVGVAAQIRTLSFVLSIVSALIMGILSVKYQQKTLVIIGLLLASVSAIGCGFSSSFTMILLTYSLSGLGMSMVAPMTFSLVAEYLPVEKRSTAIGYIIAGPAMSVIISSPAINYMAGLGGWRLAFLGYILPITLLSLAIAVLSIPSKPIQRQEESLDILQGYREVFSNRSALACLVGQALSVSAFHAIVTFSASFYRQRFSMLIGDTAIYFIATALFFLSGNLIGGRFINRIGRKHLTVLSALFSAIFTIFYVSIPFFIISIIVVLICAILYGVRYAASSSLSLEQIPEYSGSMMSMFTASENLGSALGSGIGGYILLLYGYNLVGISLGSIGILSAIIFRLFAKDPNPTKKDSNVNNLS